MSELRVHPIDGAPFGVRITGLEPDRIDREVADVLLAAYREGKGLVHLETGRLLDAGELHALTSVFGENEFAPGLVTGYGKGAAPDQRPEAVEAQVARLRAEGTDPYLTFLGNVDPRTLKAKPVDRRFFGEWEWHTDMSYIPVPPTFSLLHARRVPADGGDTAFASQVLAAAGLPDDLRRRIAGRSIKHDSTYTSAGILRPGMREPSSPVEAEGAIHPILRRVPGTGQEALFLGRRTNAHVVGLPIDESEDLLDLLWAEATRHDYCHRHRWRVGDVVVWDNRLLLHKRYPFPDDDTRLMWRTQTRGEAVVAA
jgi:taurine dioxygenase